MWAGEAVLLLIRICADEEIQRQLEVCSKRPIYKKMAKLKLQSFVFSSKIVEDGNSLSGRMEKIPILTCCANATRVTPGYFV